MLVSIQSYLIYVYSRSKFRIPLATINIVAKCCVDLACFLLQKNRLIISVNTDTIAQQLNENTISNLAWCCENKLFHYFC